MAEIVLNQRQGTSDDTSIVSEQESRNGRLAISTGAVSVLAIDGVLLESRTGDIASPCLRLRLGRDLHPFPLATIGLLARAHTYNSIIVVGRRCSLDVKVFRLRWLRSERHVDGDPVFQVIG